jgi:hypothetical protein
MPTNDRLWTDDRDDLQNRGKPSIQLDKEYAIAVRKAKALSEGCADHNSADYLIWYSLRANGSMAGSCANPNIGIMT